jgi:Winged helix-turn-helix DNA-binding
VDLRGRLSNPDIRDVVAHAAKLVSHVSVDHGSTSSPRQAGRRWRLIDRLGEQIIRELLRESRAGITQPRLAERYGISLSSVKRLTRRP